MKRGPLVIAVLVLAAFAAYWWFSNTAERQIRKQLDGLMELVEKQPEEQGLEILTKAAAAAKHFTDPCILEIAEQKHHGSYSRKDIADHVFMIRKGSEFVELELIHEVIELFDEHQARVRGTLQVLGLEGDLYTKDRLEIQLDLKKMDTWLIAKLTLVAEQGAPELTLH
jgi:DNA-binding ferritin-like protein (Dps family)